VGGFEALYYPSAIVLAGQFAYVGSYSGLSVVDVSHPTSPQFRAPDLS
jgi:hypothetical protein